jgi:LAO/AO transport system kinase
VEADLEAMLHLAAERDGWKPRIVRTVATENKGVDELAVAIKEYREHFASRTGLLDKQIAHWTRRLAALAEDLFLRRAISDDEGQVLLAALAREVATREKNPYAAARELLAHADAKRNSE